MRRVLLVWEMIPSDTRLYRLDRLDEDDYQKILGYHGRYAGEGMSEEEFNWLVSFLDDKKHVFSREDEPLQVDVLNSTIVVAGYYQ
jgi:hypothetical protein